MQISITKLSGDDLQSVDALMKKNGATLGFLPFEALTDYQKRGGLLGAKLLDGRLVGYLLSSNHHTYFRIVHLCVAEDHRDKRIARKLLDHLRTTATTQSLIKLHCRRDYPANTMWPALGFIPLDEKPGRSAAGHLLTLWCLTIAQHRQMELFQAMTLDEHLNVVVDSQIFFDFHESPTRKARPSQALLSDFLVDTLNLWITDELLVEIDRNQDPNQRECSRKRAHAFSTISYDPKSADLIEPILRTILPTTSRSKLSDLRHLAKTAASDANIFVTRDGDLLKHAKDIFDLIDVNVISPTELIVSIQEFSDRHKPTLGRVSGEDLSWRPLHATDLSRLTQFSFFEPRERHGPFIEKLNALLSRPDRYECMLLQMGARVVALRVVDTAKTQSIACPMVRISRTPDRALIERFVISETIATAIATKKHWICFEPESVQPNLTPALLDMGFVTTGSAYVRFTFPSSLSRERVLDQISVSIPELKDALQSVENIDLERHCSPVNISGTRPTYMIPIRPEYSMGLFDKQRATQDLFGGNPNILLRWDNVYYRKSTHSRMIQAPGRIFWYVSSPQKAVVAVSHLDAVEVGRPKELFRVFEKFGILDWYSIYNMCEGDISKKMMALRFSHTFSFLHPVRLDQLYEIFATHSRTPIFQSPSRVSDEICASIFQFGYEEPT